jgi:hypothetical protein
MRVICLLWLSMVSPFCCSIAVGAAEPPGASVIEENVDLLRKTYSAEYADVSTEGKQSLFHLLRRLADAEQSEPSLYAQLQEAGRIGAEAGLLDESLQAVDDLGAVFNVDASKMKRDCLIAAAKFSREFSWKKTLCDAYRDVIEEAIQQERYSAAKLLIRDAQFMSLQAKESTFNSELYARQKRVEQMDKELRGIAKPLAQLEKERDHAESNLAVGGYHCFARGDWERGLPYLSRGGESEPACLARLELAKPQMTQEILELADGWWSVAELKKPWIWEEQQRHAAALYRKVAVDLSPADKERVEKRISEAPVMIMLHRGRGYSRVSPVPYSDDPTLSIDHRVARLALLTWGSSVEFDGPKGRVTLRESDHGASNLPAGPIKIVSLSLGQTTSAAKRRRVTPRMLTPEQLEILGQLKELKRLSFSLTCPPDDLAVIGRLRSLESLHLVLGPEHRDEDLRFLDKLEHLKTLGVCDTHPTLNGDYLSSIRNPARLTGLFIGRPSHALKLSARGLEHLARFGGLRTAGLSGEQIDPAVLATLARLPALNQLVLTVSKVPDLSPLTPSPELRTLSLQSAVVGARELDLSHLPRLRSFHGSSLTFSEGGLAGVAAQPSLEEISLTAFHCDKAGLGELKPLPNLRKLVLSQTSYLAPIKIGSGLTDADLAVVGELTSLEELTIQSLEITPASLVHFQNLPELRKLDLNRTWGRLRDEDLETLRKALPECRILNTAPVSAPNVMKEEDPLETLRKAARDR